MNKKYENSKSGEVVTYYDPSLIGTGKKKTNEELELDRRNAWEIEREALGNNLSKMGFASSMGRDERKFQLQALINKGEIITLQSAMSAMGLARGTIISYLKELNIKLYDPSENRFFGAKDGKEIVPF